MATILINMPFRERNFRQYLWETLTATTTDDGEPAPGGDYSDISIQVVGNFGVGGSIQLEGSNDGVTWAILNDPFENPIILTAAGLAQVTEACRFYRVNVTAGDAAVDLDAYLFMRRPRS